MGKAGVKPNSEVPHSFFKVKTYSIAQILNAGGATAFATQMDKKPYDLAERLKSFSKKDFLTTNEASEALKNLDETK